MGTPPNPKREAVLAYYLAHPDVPAKDVSVLYGVPVGTIHVWALRAREAAAKKLKAEQAQNVQASSANTIRPAPARSSKNAKRTDSAPRAGATTSNLVSLPPPAPPMILPDDLPALARKATRNLLEHIANKDNLKGVSLRDAAIVLGTITERYDLIGPMETGKKATTSASEQTVRALMGDLPEEDETADEPIATEEATHS